MIESYGLTEAGSTVALDGAPIPRMDVAIDRGEITVRGPAVSVPG